MLVSGWEVSEITSTHYILKKPQNGWVHFALALFFWWTFFIPNIIYGIYRATSTRKILKEDGE